jgi:hypothetical protein
MRGTSFVEGLGIGALLVYLMVILSLLGLSVYGIVLAFYASIILGFVVLFTPPSGLIIGLVYVGWGKDIPDLIVKWLGS